MNIGFLVSYLLVLVFRHFLHYLNLRHNLERRHEIPPGFEGELSPNVREKTAAYNLASEKASLLESVIEEGLFLIFFFSALFPLYDRWIASLSDSFILNGILFFLGLLVLQTLLKIPFSWHHTFVLEEKFGFNRSTLRLWFSDLLKTAAISLVLTAVLLGGIFWLVRATPLWWLWVWGFLTLASLFLMVISPYVIEPLFFKFKSVADEELAEGVKTIVERAGLQVSRVLQVDASRRSGHSNAYFTGIGKVKRIVLFDTLIEQMNKAEILAVLAHEIGHWKKRHIFKRLLLTVGGSFIGIGLAYILIRSGFLPALLGLEKLSFPAQMVVLSVLAKIALFPLTPLSAWWSRRHEKEADLFAVSLTQKPLDLASALIKLARENLAGLFPHPLYAWFYFSHPPLVERVGFLRKLAKDRPRPAAN
jgi:STE24 endopeptidase